MSKQIKLKGTPKKLKGSGIQLKGIDVSLLKDIREATSGLSQALRPMSEITSYLNSEPFLSFQNDTFKAFRKIGKNFEKLAPIGKWMQSQKELEDFCEKHGLVAHDLLKSNLECIPSDFQLSFIFDNWSDIRRELYRTYAVRSVSAERHSMFNEILKTYTAGAFSVCRRAAVIEIEGLAVDFCERHGGKHENVINNSAEKAGEFTLRELGGMLPFSAIEKYSSQILQNTESYKHTGACEPDLRFSRHAHAHGEVLLADQKDALNAILLLHHFAKYFYLIDIANRK